MVGYKEIIEDIKSNPKKYIKDLDKDSDLFEIIDEISILDYEKLIYDYYSQIKSAMKSFKYMIVDVRGLGAFDLRLSQIIRLIHLNFRGFEFALYNVKKEYREDGEYDLSKEESFKLRSGYYFNAQQMDEHTELVGDFIQLYFVKMAYTYFHQDNVYMNKLKLKEKSEENLFEYEVFRAIYNNMGCRVAKTKKLNNEIMGHLSFLNLLIITAKETLSNYFITNRAKAVNKKRGIVYNREGWTDNEQYMNSVEYGYTDLYLKKLKSHLIGIEIGYINRIAFDFIYMWCNGVFGKTNTLISKGSFGLMVQEKLGLEIKAIKNYKNVEGI
jgi:hypothetical protein